MRPVPGLKCTRCSLSFYIATATLSCCYSIFVRSSTPLPLLCRYTLGVLEDKLIHIAFYQWRRKWRPHILSPRKICALLALRGPPENRPPHIFFFAARKGCFQGSPLRAHH